MSGGEGVKGGDVPLARHPAFPVVHADAGWSEPRTKGGKACPHQAHVVNGGGSKGAHRRGREGATTRGGGMKTAPVPFGHPSHAASQGRVGGRGRSGGVGGSDLSSHMGRRIRVVYALFVSFYLHLFIMLFTRENKKYSKVKKKSRKLCLKLGARWGRSRHVMSRDVFGAGWGWGSYN